MITALIILSSILVFFVAIFSPHHGTRIQMKSFRILTAVKRMSHSKPLIIRLFMDVPTHISHFALHKSAAAGKKSRWKLPF